MVIREKLARLLKGARRVAILCVGSDVHGDDAAGMAAGESIAGLLRLKRGRIPCRVFYGWDAPENLTGRIKRFKPTHLIIIDAADMKKKAGSVKLIDPLTDESGVTFSTHKFPLKLLAGYLGAECGCLALMVGIQPRTLEYGAAMSPAVAGAVREVSKLVAQTLRGIKAL